MNPLIKLKTIAQPLLIAVSFACFGLSPRAQAVTTDPEDYFPNYTTAVGQQALLNLTTGTSNTADGYQALYLNTTGNYNTANGVLALYSNTAGNGNTADGYQALTLNTTGAYNTANGVFALSSNTVGYNNTANGVSALSSNTVGYNNTANGLSALSSNTTGHDNTALGYGTLSFNTTGTLNTANGVNALVNNTTGRLNTANGVNALFLNVTGAANTAIGLGALYSNTTGSHNTAFGVNALLSNTGSSNVGLGTNAGRNLTTGFGNVCIGAGIFGAAGESNTTRIRNIYSSVASGRAVYINSNNKIGTLASTRRVKNDIKPMDKASEAVLALKPVSFRYKKEIDASGTLQFGLVAEEVADINADLVTRDSEGKPETVRYEAVNAMLLNEFLKAHRRMEEQDKRIEELTDS